MRVKPAPGLSVRDPATKKLLPPEGIDVPDNSILWTKMLNDGDVVSVSTTPPPPPPPEPKVEQEGAQEGETT
jgi:hypothetical protein